MTGDGKLLATMGRGGSQVHGQELMRILSTQRQGEGQTLQPQPARHLQTE